MHRLLVVLVVLLSACATRPRGDTLLPARSFDAPSEAPGEPRPMPFDRSPMLSNSDQITRALRALYPRDLNDADVGGQSMIWVFVDRDGSVPAARVQVSSGEPALDTVAVQVARLMRFSPARLDGDDVAIWAAIPVTFEPEPRPERATAAVEPSDPPEGSTRIPFEVPPRLTNTGFVQMALSQVYPRALRRAGIGGVTNVWIFIDEEGLPVDAQVNATSGYIELDLAAITIAKLMEFEPAPNRGQPRAVWVSIPITFSVSR